MLRSLLLQVCLLGALNGETNISTSEESNTFSNLLSKFQNCSLPCETGKIKPVLLTGEDSTFIKTITRSKNLVAVTDTTASVWDDADEEGKNHFDFPELI